MHLLLIEDDEQLAAEIAAPLSAQGFEVTRVTDGEAGLEAATTRSFDLVITDRMLPSLEGLEIVRGSGFAELDRATGEIEHIVHDLERETKVRAELLQRLHVVFWCPGEHSAHLGGAGE